MKNLPNNIFPVVLCGAWHCNIESLFKKKKKRKAVAFALLTTSSGQLHSDKIEHKNGMKSSNQICCYDSMDINEVLLLTTVNII